MICILCGHKKMAGCGMATVNGQYLCHPDNIDHPDCYKLYTVYGLRNVYTHTTGEYRKGQKAFNDLYAEHPDIANLIRTTEDDPFFDDEKLPAFYLKVAKLKKEYGIKMTSTERGRLHRDIHPNSDKDRSKNYRGTDKGRQNEVKKSGKRRAILNEVESDDWTISLVLETYGTDCWECWEPIDLNAPRHTGDIGWEKGLQIDHVIPLSKKGPNTLANVRPTHGKCNNKKGGK